MTFIARCLILLLPITLMGCSYVSKSSFVQHRDKHYLSAQSIPPLKIPPGLSSNAFQSYYPIADRYYPQNAKMVNIDPPGLNN